MKTDIEIYNEILWFKSLLTELKNGNLEACEEAIKAAIQVLEKEANA